MAHIGSSNRVAPSTKLIAEMEYELYAPAKSPIFTCCISPAMQSRMYARIYDNHLEINQPIDACCCCSSEECVVDRVKVYKFDKAPFRSTTNCCGPPVIFNINETYCCCICTNQTVASAPCNCLGLKSFCCCGSPCYFGYRDYFTLNIPSVKSGSEFLSKLKSTVKSYAIRNNLPEGEMAVFEDVTWIQNPVLYSTTIRSQSEITEHVGRTASRDRRQDYNIMRQQPGSSAPVKPVGRTPSRSRGRR